MKIAVIGAGKIGGTIGGKWEGAGHEVAYGLREQSKRQGGKPFHQALEGAEVVLLALPGAAVADFVREHSRDLDGKVIIDATNNFGGASMNSWPELTAAVPHAHLYRAFSSLGWEMFANPIVGGVQVDHFYAGPESDKETVERLISEVGLRPIRVGDADQAAAIDGMLRLWATLSRTRGRRTAFKLISDSPHRPGRV